MPDLKSMQERAVILLQELIKNPSFSGSEDRTAEVIAKFCMENGLEHIRINNNVLLGFKEIDPSKPTCLLNSHHDTVKVVNGWIKDPFGAEIEEGRLYGLGSNDAGASLVSLLCAYALLDKEDLPVNVVMAATAEEENFGPLGVKSLIDQELSIVDFGIVGEPTNMEMGVAEKGLLVIDGEALGVAGHAARQEGENAIYKAMLDIDKISKHKFDRVSDVLGSNIMSVTQVNAGTQHNVVPDSCRFVIDLRVNECYTLQEAFEEVQNLCTSDLRARSFNNPSSGISLDHPLVKAGKRLELHMFGSATLSDQANMPFPTIKIGPGFSERSHTPNEYIKLTEVDEGVKGYYDLVKAIRVEDLTDINVSFKV